MNPIKVLKDPKRFWIILKDFNRFKVYKNTLKGLKRSLKVLENSSRFKRVDSPQQTMHY